MNIKGCLGSTVENLTRHKRSFSLSQHLPFGHNKLIFFSQTSHQEAWISLTVTITLIKEC